MNIGSSEAPSPPGGWPGAVQPLTGNLRTPAVGFQTKGRLIIGSLFNGVLSRRRDGANVLWLSVLGIAVVVAACGGGDGDADAGPVVTSADGLATLTVDAGSLPAGVALEDLSLEAAVIESDDPAMPMLAVQLLPDGLVLEQPIALTVTLPRPPSGGLVVVHTSGDSLEFLAGEFEVAGEELTFTTAVEHFSLITYVDYEMAGFAPTLSLAPEQVVEGQSQTAVAKVNLPRIPFNFWGHFSSDSPDEWRLVGFSAPLPPVQLRVPVYVWGSSWDPTARRVGATPTPTGWDIGRALSRCVIPNITSVQLSAEAVFDVELLGVSAPIAPVLRISAIMPTNLDPQTRIEARLGELVHLTVNIYSSAPTSCVGLAGTTATSSGTSSSSPPVDEDASSIHLVGSAGDFTCKNPDNTLDPALDITGVDAVQDGDGIEVTLTFDGDAEAYENATTEKFPFSFQLRLKEDTAGYPEVFFAEKGEIKVSGGLLQVVSYEFSGNKLIIRLKGRTLEDVHAVQASTFIFDGGRCQDLINSPGYND